MEGISEWWKRGPTVGQVICPVDRRFDLSVLAGPKSTSLFSGFMLLLHLSWIRGKGKVWWVWLNIKIRIDRAKRREFSAEIHLMMKEILLFQLDVWWMSFCSRLYILGAKGSSRLFLEPFAAGRLRRVQEICFSIPGASYPNITNGLWADPIELGQCGCVQHFTGRESRFAHENRSSLIAWENRSFFALRWIRNWLIDCLVTARCSRNIVHEETVFR